MNRYILTIGALLASAMLVPPLVWADDDPIGKLTELGEKSFTLGRPTPPQNPGDADGYLTMKFDFDDKTIFGSVVPGTQTDLTPGYLVVTIPAIRGYPAQVIRLVEMKGPVDEKVVADWRNTFLVDVDSLARQRITAMEYYGKVTCGILKTFADGKLTISGKMLNDPMARMVKQRGSQPDPAGSPRVGSQPGTIEVTVDANARIRVLNTLKPDEFRNAACDFVKVIPQTPKPGSQNRYAVVALKRTYPK